MDDDTEDLPIESQMDFDIDDTENILSGLLVYYFAMIHA